MRKKCDGTLNGEGRTDVKCKDLEKRTWMTVCSGRDVRSTAALKWNG